MLVNRRTLIAVVGQLLLVVVLYSQRANIWSHPVLSSFVILASEIALLLAVNPQNVRFRIRFLGKELAEEKKRHQLPTGTLRLCEAAVSSIHSGNYEQALQRLSEAHLATQELRIREAESLCQSAQWFMEIARFQRAIKLLNRALLLVREAGLNDSGVLNQLGFTYWLSGEPALAINSLEPALAGAVNAGDVRLESDIASTLGTVFAGMGEFDRAAKFHLHALIVGSGLEDGASFRANTLLNLASDHHALNQNGKALSYLRRAHELFVSSGFHEEATHVEEFIAQASELSTETEKAEFSAFYEPTPEVESQQVLRVYVHLPRMIEQINIGTPITVVPESAELEFEPYAVSKKWNGSWIGFTFNFRPHKSLADEVLMIRISFQISGLEVAHIECPVTLRSPELKNSSLTTSENRIAEAKLTKSRAYLYRNIFVSYSRHDRKIVEVYKFAQLAVGDDVFVDTDSIRSGDDWHEALAQAIDKADIFQLFWSKNSAASDNVTQEWEYALTHRCPEDRCVGFIRPVYWERPMPAPPDQLKHLNFKFSPLDLS